MPARALLRTGATTAAIAALVAGPAALASMASVPNTQVVGHGITLAVTNGTSFASGLTAPGLDITLDTAHQAVFTITNDSDTDLSSVVLHPVTNTTGIDTPCQPVPAGQTVLCTTPLDVLAAPMGQSQVQFEVRDESASGVLLWSGPVYLHRDWQNLTTQAVVGSQHRIVVTGETVPVSWTVQNPNSATVTPTWDVPAGVTCTATVEPSDVGSCDGTATATHPGPITVRAAVPGSGLTGTSYVVATAVQVPKPTLALNDAGETVVTVTNPAANPLPVGVTVRGVYATVAPGTTEALNAGVLPSGSTVTVDFTFSDVTRHATVTVPAAQKRPVVVPNTPALARHGELVGVTLTNPAENEDLLWVQAGIVETGFHGVEPGETVVLNGGRYAAGETVHVAVAEEDGGRVLTEFDLAAPAVTDTDKGMAGCRAQNMFLNPGMTEDEADEFCVEIGIPNPEPTGKKPTVKKPTPTVTKPIPTVRKPTENPPVHKPVPPVTRIDAGQGGGAMKDLTVPASLAVLAALLAGAGTLTAVRRRPAVR